MRTSEFEEAYDDEIERIELPDRVREAILEKPVSELMAREPIIIDAEATVVSAVNLMNEHRTGCVLVQKDGKLVGIFTERDVLRKVIFHENNRTWKVGSVMTASPETLPPTASVAVALNRMSVDGFRHVPIVDRAGKPIGVLSVKDIVHFVVDWFPDSILNLPSNPDKATTKTADGG